MTTALDRTRALLDTPPPAPIPGQLAVASSEPSTEPEHDEQPLIHHQPSLWSI
ncbi:hypothetical protein [Streptomyces sp. LN549]|uniref:hypothetical protein n=1 Tax=Streptomyces sp. LN549 TaxID=3112979 RepID=UPI00371F0527